MLHFKSAKKFVCKKICLRTLATAAATRLALRPPPSEHLQQFAALHTE
jgi:hypothetical protein